MVKVAGLRPFEEDTPQRGSGRIKVQRPIETDGGIQRMPRLRPTASPVDTYARPPQMDRGNELLRLADSLGNLVPALNRFGSVAKENEDRAALAAFQRNRDRPDFDTWATQTPEGQRSTRNMAVQGMLGEQRAQRTGESMVEEWRTTFDRDNGNVDQWIAERMARETANKPEVEVIAYRQRMQPFFDQIRRQQQEYRVGRENQTIQSGLTDIYAGAIAEGVKNGSDAASVLGSINQRLGSDQRYLGVDQPRRDAIFLNALDQHARQTGNRDFLDQLLRAPRIVRNPDGSERNLGSYAENPDFAAQVNRIREQAQQKDREQGRLTSVDQLSAWNDKADQGQLTAEDDAQMKFQMERGILPEGSYQALRNRNREFLQRQELIRQRDETLQGARAAEEVQRQQVFSGATQAIISNRTAALREAQITKFDAEGRPTTERISVQQQVQEASRAQDQALDQAVRNRDKTPQEALTARAQWYSNVGSTGVTYDPWKQQLEAGHLGLNMASATARDGKPSPEILAGYNLFLQLRTSHPRVLDSHIGREARETYERIEALQRIGRNTPEQAVQQAFISQQQRAQEKPEIRENRERDIDAAVQSLRDGGLAGWFGQRLANANDPAVTGEIQRMARFFGETLPKDQALAKAKERFMETHRIVNGAAVNVNDVRTPDWFKDEAETYMRAVADQNRDDGIEYRDLMIMRLPNSNVFQLVTRGSRIPVAGTDVPGGLPSAFTMEQLTAYRAQREQRDAQKAADETARRNDPLIQIGPITIGRPRLGGYDDGDLQMFNRRSDEMRGQQGREAETSQQNRDAEAAEAVRQRGRPNLANPDERSSQWERARREREQLMMRRE